MKLYIVYRSLIEYYALELKNKDYCLLINYYDVKDNFLKDFDHVVYYRKKNEIDGKLKKINVDDKVFKQLFFYIFTINSASEFEKNSLKELLMFLNGEEY